MNKTYIINTDNTNKYTEKWKKNKLLHLYFDGILVVGRASIQQNMLGNRLAICMFFYSKKSKLFYFHPPACLIFQDKTDVNQTINSLRPNAFLLKSAISSHNSCVLTNASGQIFCLAVPLLFCYFVAVGIIIIIYLC